ncbi:MAG: putative selenate reductase subunit YgfK [Bacteroidales bacterium]|nr:putative selenate reductase subunit YgfK [Bacteroidales bacterium]
MIHSTAFSPVSAGKLFTLIETEFTTRKEIFGIPEKLFFNPENHEGLSMDIFGQHLYTPLGVAAGPHTQMAQNIISAWLCGASYIELKTIQTLDELEISKPCIDMQDEGYNCEWSQELRIHESFDEYLKAWILIHLLQHKFGWDKQQKRGFIFNMSIGYNFAGIQNENMQWFLKSMSDCGVAKQKMIDELLPFYPELANSTIPDRISDNITLSTMHGCPPDEIEKIGHYLLKEKKLHTLVKLNPTLLGKDELRDILNNKLGFKNTIPDIAFEHDLKYPDAIGIIQRLQQTADSEGLFFGVKLTNTLESINHKNVFPVHEQMMYMSGRALHPISVNVVRKLQNEFNGKLNVSFSAGADCFNINDLIESGLKPVTVCSDILKPGGYGRLAQYIENLSEKKHKETRSPLEKLNAYADEVVLNEDYKRDPFATKSIKTSRSLGFFDCIHAPCVDECPTNQDIPEYLYHTSQGDFQKAFDVIMIKNPFPNVLGVACDHMCQTKCTRINYEQALKIKEVKRFVAEKGFEADISISPSNGKKVAIIGAGPSGLSCAYFLRMGGFEVEIFETKSIPGGMVSEAIPEFRLKMESLRKDIERIENLGVKIQYNSKIDSQLFARLRSEYDSVYIAAGAQRFKTLQMEGENAAGILNAFEFLKNTKLGKLTDLGKNIIVIGGGNTAMDVARTAKRFSKPGSSVKVLYRRTRNEMPADVDEIKALLTEGIELHELLAPEKLVLSGNRISSIVCTKMELVKSSTDSRLAPVKIAGQFVEFPVDSLIPALGQDIDIDFITYGELQTVKGSYETSIPGVFVGGDAMRGAATIVKAVGDGRKAAIQIAAKAGIVLPSEKLSSDKKMSHSDFIVAKSRRIKIAKQIAGDHPEFTAESAIQEASRCLQCGDVCSVCVTVCPNRANNYYHTQAAEVPVWKVGFSGEDASFEIESHLKIQQKYQVLNVADFCNECGNCTTFCPTKGSPFSDKPRFCLTEKSFNQTENGFLLQKNGDTSILLHRNGDKIMKLTKDENAYNYSDEEISVSFDLVDFHIIHIIKLKAGNSGITLNKAAEMKVLIDSVTTVGS